MEHKNINELEAIVLQPSYRALVEKIVAAKEVVLLPRQECHQLYYPIIGYIFK